MTTTTSTNTKKARDAFGLPLEEWERYLQFRPPYPDSQWKLWVEYHKGALDVVHEVGTGCGIGMAGFLKVAQDTKGQPIRRAILSDPTDSNIAASKALIAKRGFPGTEFEYHQFGAEGRFLEPNSVDLVMACECLHFTQIEEALARMHESLRAGGTMAAAFYDCFTASIKDSPRVEKAYHALLADMLVGVVERRLKAAHEVEDMGRYKNFPKVGSGLNWVAFDPEQWVDVERVFVNIPDGLREWPYNEGLKNIWVGNENHMNEAVEKLQWVQDREGWGMKKATVDWVKGLLGTLDIKIEPSFWEGSKWLEFVDATNEVGGSFEATFPAAYVMARKK